MRENKIKMLEAIEEWRTSGLKQKEYCRKHGITHSSFYYWLSKSKIKSHSNDFISIGKIGMSNSLDITPSFEIVNRKGTILRIYTSISSQLLLDLMNA